MLRSSVIDTISLFGSRPSRYGLREGPSRLAQLLSNLLDNAAKYTPDGGEISVVAESVADEVCIRVRDNEIGIPRHQIDGIFDLYAQLEGSATTPSGGLGLGLALLRSLVDLHGGTIEVVSEGSDKGSQFTVRLPILSKPALHANAKEAPQAVSAPRRILLVEDNADVAETMEQILAMGGHTVCVAADGKWRSRGCYHSSRTSSFMT